MAELQGSECVISALHIIGWNLFQMSTAASLCVVCVDVHTHVRAHVCGGWRSTLSAFHLALPLDGETGSLTELERPGLAKLIASEPQGSSCLCLS